MVIDTDLRFDRQSSYVSAACRINTTWLNDVNRKRSWYVELTKSSTPAGRVFLVMGLGVPWAFQPSCPARKPKLNDERLLIAIKCIMLTLVCGGSAFLASCQANLRQVHEGTSSSTYAENRAKQHAETVKLQPQGYHWLKTRVLQFEDLTVQRHYHRHIGDFTKAMCFAWAEHALESALLGVRSQ